MTASATEPATDPATDPAIDLDRLGRLATWMDGGGLPGPGEPIEHRFLSGGTCSPPGA